MRIRSRWKVLGVTKTAKKKKKELWRGSVLDWDRAWIGRDSLLLMILQCFCLVFLDALRCYVPYSLYLS
jgi:hypothetical protein